MESFENIYQKYLIESIHTYESTMKELHKLFKEYKIKHVFIGGSVLPMHGFYRNTGDVDILINKKDKQKIKDFPIGYIKVSDSARKGIYHKTKTSLDFLYSGDEVGENSDIVLPCVTSEIVDSTRGYPILTLQKMVEFKLGSGLYAMDRLMDFGDIQRLISKNHLKENYMDYTRDELKTKYKEIWNNTKEK